MTKNSDLIKFYVDSDESLYKKKELVRNLISDSHWQSDGLYKEALLKEILEDKLSGTKYHVGSGFIINKTKQIACNKQIDILIFEKYPTHVFRHHGFYIVDARSVRAIIEVKTKSDDYSKFEKAIVDMNRVGEFLQKHGMPVYNHFIGVFAYEGYESKCYKIDSLKKKLETIFNKESIRNKIISHYGVNFINLNRDILIERNYDRLSIYKLEKQSYSNYIERLCDWLIDLKYTTPVVGGQGHRFQSPIEADPFFQIQLTRNDE